MTDSEAEIHGELYIRMKDYLEENETSFDEIHSEYTIDGGDGYIDILVESKLIDNLVVEVKKDDIYLLDDENIVQARDYAESVNTGLFALANSTNLFLFDYNGELNTENIDFYYLNLDSYDNINSAINDIFSSIEFLYKKGRLPEQDKKEKVVAVLRTFHSSVWPVYKSLAKQKYGKDARFTNRLDEWIDKNDYANKSKDEQYEIAAKQHSYLLANRVLFYQVIRENDVDDGYDVILNRLDDIKESGVSARLKEKFSRVVEKIDYEPILDDEGTVFEVFPENKKTQSFLQQLLISMASKNIENISEDLLGSLYEELIPSEERKRLGQFYTPPNIAESISSWACDTLGEDPMVLDPASGSGTFTVELYKQLRDNGYSHQQAISRIYAVDINRFPLHLTALNLARQEIDQVVDRINTKHSSFFDLEFDHKFDAIVGNPPYIKHNYLHPNKEHFREHLAHFDTKKYYSGSRRISSKADAYIYFCTRGIQLLKKNGRMGYIIPNKWLDVKYGKNPKALFDDKTRIQAVIGFSSRVFDDAKVDACILLVEKDLSENKSNNVDFIRIEDEMTPEDLVSTVKFQQSVDGDYEIDERDSYRIVSIPQNKLFNDGYGRKLSYLLRAPSRAIEIIREISDRKLSDFASVEQGSPTGANDFFYVEKENKWDIDKKFLTPSLKNLKQVDNISRVGESESRRYILDMNDFVESVEFKDQSESMESLVKNKLREEGYNGVLDYIEHGESEGYNDMSKPSKRDVWFNMGTLSTPEIIHPKSYNENIRVIRSDELRISDRLKGIAVKEEYEEEFIYRYLNSELYKLTVECFGRREGGGSLEIMTYELRDMPVPNFDEINTSWFHEGMDQDEFDQNMLNEIGINISVSTLRKLRKSMTKERVGLGEQAQNLLKEVEEVDSGFIEQDEYEDN